MEQLGFEHGTLLCRYCQLKKIDPVIKTQVGVFGVSPCSDQPRLPPSVRYPLHCQRRDSYLAVNTKEILYLEPTLSRYQTDLGVSTWIRSVSGHDFITPVWESNSNKIADVLTTSVDCMLLLPKQCCRQPYRGLIRGCQLYKQLTWYMLHLISALYANAGGVAQCLPLRRKLDKMYSTHKYRGPSTNGQRQLASFWSTDAKDQAGRRVVWPLLRKLFVGRVALRLRRWAAEVRKREKREVTKVCNKSLVLFPNTVTAKLKEHMTHSLGWVTSDSLFYAGFWEKRMRNLQRDVCGGRQRATPLGLLQITRRGFVPAQA